MRAKKWCKTLTLVLLGLSATIAAHGCADAGRSSPTTKVDTVKLANDSKAAVAPELATLAKLLGRNPVREVKADTDGTVYVTLSFTKEYYLEGTKGRGKSALSGLSALVASSVFYSVPEAQRVATFDDNDDLLESWRRSEWGGEPPPAAAEAARELAADHTAMYKVDGVGGALHVSYTNTRGELEREMHAALPWETSVPVVSGSSLQVIDYNGYTGEPMTVRISVDGEELAVSSDRDKNGILSVTATCP